MSRHPLRIGLAALLAAAGCSHLGSSTGPVAIQLVLPSRLELEVNDTLQLQAFALDENGDSIGSPIVWRAGDTTIAVDSTTGRLTALYAGTIGRVQARSGTLVSDVVTFSTFVRADTIVVDSTADTTTVLSGDSVSAALVASIRSFVTDTGIFNRRLTYAIVSPTDSSVTLDGGALVASVSTASDGTPAAPVHVHKTAAPAPDSAVVTVSAQRPSGTAVPGSGQRFVVHFQP